MRRPIAIVTGMVVTYPVGGVAWDYLQYAMALEQAGFEVYYLEDTGWEVYDPSREVYGQDCAYGVAFLRDTLRAIASSMAERWCFRNMDGSVHGMGLGELKEVARTADLFLNVSGGTLLRDEYMPCPRKVLIDTDPGWNHFVNFPKWDANPGWYGSHGWRAHDAFFTYAQRIGRPGCELPTLGIDWRPTRPLVAIDRWRPEPPAERWTTIMTWNNFGKPIEHAGRTYGSKEREFLAVEQLPARVASSLEIAAGGTPPVERWRELGWSVVDSHAVSRTADEYRRYIQSSRGELSVAKNVYVATRSGWFSCRTVCYLAAGRPAIVQETGFSERTPNGEGLIAFTDAAGAAAGVRAVEADYARHSRAARRVAEEHFDSRLVLREMLQPLGLT